MFDRIKIKKDAKAKLKGNYVVMLAAAFVLAGFSAAITFISARLGKPAGLLFSCFSFIVTAVITYAYVFLCVKTSKSDEPAKFSDFTEGLTHIRPAILGSLWEALFVILWELVIIIPTFIIASVILASSILKGMDLNNLEDYLERMFSDSGSLFDGMTSALSSTLIVALVIFLILVLFFVVFTIKKIQYSQMPMILAENPDMSVRKAMRLSIEYTKGNKGNLFVFGLSFIGWILLAMLPSLIFARNAHFAYMNGTYTASPIFSILLAFLMPYINMAFVYAYYNVKQDAFDTGRVKEENIQ